MTKADLDAAVEKAQEAEKQARLAAERAERVVNGKWPAIWLEVSEVRYDSSEKGACSVQLKGDREQPKPIWWLVKDKALKDDPFETYKSILNEMDKKRLVLARLSCSTDTDCHLHCDAFRFQTPEPGGR